MPTQDEMGAEEIPVISPGEGQLRQQSGGYGADGKPAGAAMVDTALQSSAGDLRRAQPNPQATPATQRTVGSVEAAITGTEDLPPVKSPTGGNKPPYNEPHQFDMVNYNDPEAIKRAAARGGIDVSLLTPNAISQIQSMYQSAHDPGVLSTVRNFMGKTGFGAFMRGWENGEPSDTIPYSDLEKVNPTLAENRKAVQFFGNNIQTRIYEGGQYVSPDGVKYVPPDSYKYGRLIGSVMANPGSIFGAGAAGAGGDAVRGVTSAASPSSWATAGNAGSGATAGVAAFQGAMQAMKKGGQALQVMAANNPRAAAAIVGIAKYGAFGWMLHGGIPAPAP